MKKTYMAVTADRLELPCIVGTAKEVAAFVGITVTSLYSAVCRKDKPQTGYRIYRVE